MEQPQKRIGGLWEVYEMDEQRAWLKARRKRRLRILAVMLSFCVLFHTYPDILATLSAFAATGQEQLEMQQITGFTALSEEIREQTVPLGTPLSKLTLPGTLEAVVTGQTSEDTEDKTDDGGKEDAGGNGSDEDSEENDGEAPDGTEDEDGGTGETEEGEPSDSEQDDTETGGETEDKDAESGDGQDEQPEDGESEETDGTTEAENGDEGDSETEENSEGESAPAEEQGGSDNGQENAPAEEQQESAPAQETHTVTMPEYLAENVISVQTLENTQTEKQDETVTIDGVTWQSEPEYDENTEGTYIFTAILPDGYALAEGVSLPQITVTVENGIDAIIQALRDRIAALPEVEEYLALEPDMEDEDAYAEWEEKLYEYAEEAFAIWEEYEALTGEQQAQISEEELAKLTAWVELAETLSDNNAVMLAGYSEHHGESDWTELTASDTTLTNGKYYLSGDIEMGTITINGGDVMLCLNGHKLQHNGTDGSVIVVGSGTFTLCDCQDHWGYTSSFDEDTKTYSCEMTGTGGCITGGRGTENDIGNICGGGIFVRSGATFNMNSGRITGCDVGTGEEQYGGGVYVTGGTFNMSGGFLDGNMANCGGGVYIENKAGFTMSGNATVMNNEGNAGGGVYILDGTFNMTSGNILGNKGGGYGGGAIMVGGGTSESPASFIMSGGMIEGNTIKDAVQSITAGIYCNGGTLILSEGSIQHNIGNTEAAGGIRMLAGTLEVSGNIRISDNYGWNGANNLSLARNCTITVTGELSNDIGVTYRPARGTVSYPLLVVKGTNSYSISDADWSHFSSDNEKYEIQKKETTDTGNELYLAEPGKCDLFNLSTSGATLSPSPFDPDTTRYTSEVANSVNQVGITATLASTASGANITIKINDGTTEEMESGVLKTVNLAEGENTIVITVTSGDMSKAYTIKITREEAKGNPVTITPYKDGAEWTASAPVFKLTSDSSAPFVTDLTAVPDGTYHIYYDYGSDKDIDTGKIVNVNGAPPDDIRVDYFTVTFYDEGKVLTSPAQQIVLEGAAASAPATNPTKTGYTFDKWVTADGGSTGYDFANEKVTGKTSVYASWTPVTYTITYDLAGGTLPAGKTNPADYTIETEDITLQNPECAGYTFAGWSGTGLAADSTTVTIAKGSTGNRKYTANWTAKTYGITLNGNGGTGDDLTDYTYGQGAVLPANWTKTGYTFAGWYDNKDCTGTPVTEVSATDTGDKTFWAKWTPQNYQVSFEYYGADGGDTTASKNVTYAGKYGTLPVPSRTGYTFKGWYTAEAEGQGTEVNAETTVTTASAHTLHARWKDETAPAKPVLQDNVTLPKDWTNAQDKIPLKLYDGVGVTELWVSIDGSDSYTKIDGFTSGTGSMTYDYPSVTEGEHTYCFKAVDAAGNESEESDSFTVKLDQTKPVIGTLTYENKAKDFLDWIIGKKSMVVHVPVTDTGSGVDKISYKQTPRKADGTLDSASEKTETAEVRDGEAKITFDKDFRGIITITCTDKAGNAADSVTIGTEGVIVEDTPPAITTNAKTDYYDTPTDIKVTVKDDPENAISAGIASPITYKVGEDGEEQTVNVAADALKTEVIFDIPASQIPTGITEITVTATDNAGNEATKTFTVKVKGPEKTPAAEIDYRQEKLTKLVPGGTYDIGGTEYTADTDGCIPIIDGWFGNTVNIIRKGNGNETTDSPAQSLPIPARPAAPDAPELDARTDSSITLKTITGAQYRLAEGTGNWQDSTAFTGLAQKTIYQFKAYYPATDSSFASLESNEAQIATMPTAPTKEKLVIGYIAETFTLTDGIEAFTDAGCQNPVSGSDVTVYMGQTLYIRYPANGIIPASLTTAVPVPARPAKPTPGKTDASYPAATDGAITGLTSGTTYEYRVKNTDGSFGAWKDATPSGTKIENLPAGEYEIRVKAVETGNASFQSGTATVTIGAKPATKYETPDIRIDYTKETLTGFVPGAAYTINNDIITAGADGTLPIRKEWFGTNLSIRRNGNDKDKLDSDIQSLPVPARPAKPAPTGVDVTAPGGTGKLTDLTAGTAYEVSTDGGRTWADYKTDGNGQITGLAPGTYTVRVKAGTSNFASENSDPAEIGAYQIKVTFMADGQKYREVSADYGAALTDIPPVPAKENAIGEWCMDEQGTTPAVFTNITADMTVYAVYTTVYTVTLQTGTGYTLSAETGSQSPVREGGCFTFRFTLSSGYQKTAGFAVKVNGVEVELTSQEPYTYTIRDIRENKTVTVEGVAKKPGKPADSGDKDKGDDPEPENPAPRPEDTNPDNPSPRPPVTPPAKPTPPAPAPGTPTAEKQPESRPGTRPKKAETAAPEESTEPEKEPGTETPEPDGTGTETAESTDIGQPKGTPAQQAEVKLGNGTVIVTVVCEEEKCTAAVADTEAVVKAVLTPDQQELVYGGETIEIRIDVTDISGKVPAQDKEVIGSGIEAYSGEIPGLVLGMYVDISMFIRIGAGDWNAITETDEPIEVVVNIPEKLLSDGREYYIIRAHNGEYTFMNDIDDKPETITISTELFSSYAIAYVQTDSAGADAKCGLCHICPTFLGICYFIWLAFVLAVIAIVIFVILRRRKKEEQEGHR